jgi:hypothetical protein
MVVRERRTRDEGLTITCYNKEFIFFCNFMTGYVGIGSYYLGFRGQRIVLFKLKISKGTGKGKISCSKLRIVLPPEGQR